MSFRQPQPDALNIEDHEKEDAKRDCVPKLVCEVAPAGKDAVLMHDGAIELEVTQHGKSLSFNLCDPSLATNEESDDITIVIECDYKTPRGNDNDSTTAETQHHDKTNGSVQAKPNDVDEPLQVPESETCSIIAEMKLVRKMLEDDVALHSEQSPACETARSMEDKSAKTARSSNREYVAKEIATFGSIRLAACSYISVVQRHLDTAEARSRMLTAYKSVQLGDEFNKYTGEKREDLKFLLGMHELVKNEPQLHDNMCVSTPEDTLSHERCVQSANNVTDILHKTAALGKKGVGAALAGGASSLSAGLHAATFIARPR